MLAPFSDALRALVFTLGGALLAWLWSAVSPLAPMILVAFALLVSWVLTKVGESKVGTNDALAMRLMETRLGSIGVLTAATGAIGIVIAVEVVAPEGATGYPKELLSTLSAALVAFVTAISVTADKADAAVGDYIRKVFQLVYVRQGQKTKPNQVELIAGSDAHRAVMSSAAFGLNDWTKDNRHTRLAYLTGKRGNGGKISPSR